MLEDKNVSCSIFIVCWWKFFEVEWIFLILVLLWLKICNVFMLCRWLRKCLFKWVRVRKLCWLVLVVFILISVINNGINGVVFSRMSVVV